MSSIKKSLVAFSFIASLFGWFGNATPVFACSCAMATPAEQFDNATAVFVGTVQNISLDGGRSIDFDISESRKGSVAGSVTVTTGWGNGDCGFDFEVGKEYVVYASDEGQLETSICSGTSLLVAGTQDGNGEVAITNSSAEPIEEEKSGNSIASTVVAVVISFVAGASAMYIVERRKKTR